MCYQTPQVQFVCVKRDLPLYFGGICVQRDSDTLKTFKPHLALNKAPATTCPPSNTFFLFLFFFLSSINRCFLEKLLLLLSNY